MFTLLVAVALAAAGPDPARLEAQARAIEAQLIAPCCWSQPVSVHDSPAAQEVRQEIRAMLAAGRSRDEIFEAFVERHGIRILAEPPARGVSLWLYVLPVALFFGSAVWVARVVRRATAPAAAVMAPGSATTGESVADTQKLDDVLRDMD
jgi:cytochrome c-type biogenesis protein CcmH